jgi:ABC-type multidrug transport system fused ATPase/permease subunit
VLQWYEKKLNENINKRANFNNIEYGASQWFEMRCTVSQDLIIQLGSMILLIFYYDHMTVAKFGLFSICSFDLAATLKEALSSRIHLDCTMVAVERCNKLSEMECEKNYFSYNEEKAKFSNGGSKLIKKLKKYEERQKAATRNIVHSGRIELKNLSARYLSSKNMVLKNLNLKIEPGEKIGVIGRTGSGKSSLIKIFWKYLEPTEGDAFIDGSNLRDVDLKTLRSQITVIT